MSQGEEEEKRVGKTHGGLRLRSSGMARRVDQLDACEACAGHEMETWAVSAEGCDALARAEASRSTCVRGKKALSRV